MKIVIDEYKLKEYHDYLIVEDDNSFVQARKQILDFKVAGKFNKEIAVLSYPYSVWFFDLENEGQIKIERVLPSRMLKEKFQTVQIDTDLEEKEIVNLDLLNLSIEPTEISIVNKFIGSFLLKQYALKEQLYYITEFAANPTRQFVSSKYLQKKWAKYLNRIQYDNPLIKSVLYKIKEGDPDFCKVINQLIYVSNSQFLLKEWLHDNSIYLQTILQGPIDYLEKFLTESKFQVSLNAQYETIIEKFYKKYYNADLDNFFKEDGHYKASLTAFLRLAKGITRDQMDLIIAKYGKYLDFELSEKIKSLLKPEIIPPPQVESLLMADQIFAWQSWAVKYFIPFKFYLDDSYNDNDAMLVDEYANNYADWLFNSYSAIIQSGLKSNYNIVNTINDNLNNCKVIWLIIDGFSSVYVDVLISILKSNGINNIREEYHFAAIPTITSIGIPTQLNGKTPQSDTYTLNRENALKHSFSSKRVIFKNSIGNFKEALESDFDLCCLHWKEIDEVMHKEDNDIEGQRIDEVKQLLNYRIEQIAENIKGSTDRKVKLMISTDHGVTKCLVKGQSINNSHLMDASKDNPKERCVELTGSLAKVNLDESEIYYLKAEQAFNRTDWAIARGYKYFGRFDYGYRHGGLTPEETIVPFLSCEVSLHEILPISVSFGGLVGLQLGFTEIIRFIIKNDNDALIDILKVSVIEDKNFSIDLSNRIQPLSSRSFDGKIKLSKATQVINDKTQINVSINYLVFGEE